MNKTLKMLQDYFPETKDINEGVALIVEREYEIFERKWKDSPSSLLNNEEPKRYYDIISIVVYRICKQLSQLKCINFKVAPGPCWGANEKRICCQSRMIGRMPGLYFSEKNKGPYNSWMDYEAEYVCELSNKIVASIQKEVDARPGCDFYFHSFEFWDALKHTKDDDSFIVAIRYAKDYK